MVQVNEHGNNANIRVTVLKPSKMRRLGFTDHNPEQWYQYWQIDNDISLNVRIKKDGSDWRIDVFDERFLQPYDYQRLLEENPDNLWANMTKAFVDSRMLWLKSKGVISNWDIGDYV